MMPVLRRAGAQCLGTCILVVIGDGAIIVNTATGLLTPLVGALLFGGGRSLMILLRQDAFFSRHHGDGIAQEELNHCL